MPAPENATSPETPTRASLARSTGSAVIVGIACCPRVQAMIHRLELNPPSWHSTPMLIDPRLSADTSEVYYDIQQWHQRCKEQFEWDRQQNDESSHGE